MKYLVLLLVLLPASVGWSLLLELEDNEGRTIQARILHLEGEHVRIERSDGQVFTLPLTRLSEKSRKAVESSFKTVAESGSVSLLVEFERSAPPVVDYQIHSTDTGRSIQYTITRPAGQPFVADVVEAPDGDYLLRINATDYAGQIHPVKIQNGSLRLGPAFRHNGQHRVAQLWKPRYLIMSYYVVYSDEPDFTSPAARFHRVAVSHLALPPVLGDDFGVWQGQNRGHFGPNPILSRHRFGQSWGHIDIGRRREFETTNKFPADQKWRGADIPGDPDRAYLIKLLGNTPNNPCFVKLWVEGFSETPPPGVEVFRPPGQ